jgi:hypothetical protein
MCGSLIIIDEKSRGQSQMPEGANELDLVDREMCWTSTTKINSGALNFWRGR